MCIAQICKLNVFCKKILLALVKLPIWLRLASDEVSHSALLSCKAHARVLDP